MMYKYGSKGGIRTRDQLVTHTPRISTARGLYHHHIPHNAEVRCRALKGVNHLVSEPSPTLYRGLAADYHTTYIV